MDILNQNISEYMKNLLPPRDQILSEMEQYARENKFPIIGPHAGTFLTQLVAITNARNIFEMGSGFGYSAYWFARGMNNGGRIICTEGSEVNRKLALQYLTKAGFDKKVEYHVGDARDIIRNFDGPFDIILNDIDKEQYPEAFDLAIPRLRKGGIFITDNVLWSGRVLDKEPSESTRGILKFNEKLFGSGDIISSIIPIRDGLGMAVKL